MPRLASGWLRPWSRRDISKVISGKKSMTACFGNDGLEHVKTQLEERLNIAKLHEYSVLH